VGLPKFEGHVMLDKDEYQTSVQLKFRHCLRGILRQFVFWLHT